MAETTLLEKLEFLQHRFEEVSTLITDPSVIGDMKRFVKLNKEYRDLEKIVAAQKEYQGSVAEHRRRPRIAGHRVRFRNPRNGQGRTGCQPNPPSRSWKPRSSSCSFRPIRKMPRTPSWKSAAEPVVTKPPSLQVTCSKCTSAIAKARVGGSK